MEDVKRFIDVHPKTCNLCGGKVVFCSNKVIYGKEYGSGKCYLCTKCGAYTGTHRPRPREALGLLADESMRKGKVMCHYLFDALWQGKPKAQKKRKDLYAWLAGEIGVPVDECHFGYMDIHQLRAAFRILKAVQNQSMRYDKYGKLFFCNPEE